MPESRDSPPYPCPPNLQSRQMLHQGVHAVASLGEGGQSVMVTASASESASHEITSSFTQVAAAPGL